MPAARSSPRQPELLLICFSAGSVRQIHVMEPQRLRPGEREAPGESAGAAGAAAGGGRLSSSLSVLQPHPPLRRLLPRDKEVLPAKTRDPEGNGFVFKPRPPDLLNLPAVVRLGVRVHWFAMLTHSPGAEKAIQILLVQPPQTLLLVRCCALAFLWFFFSFFLMAY